MAGAAPAAQTKTSGGKPAVKSRPAPRAPIAAKVSPAVDGAQRGGGPALTLGGTGAPATDVQPPEPIVAKLAPDEIDLSTGELAIPEEAADALKEGAKLDAKVRLPGLAEGTLHLLKKGTTFNTQPGGEAILLRHPALKRFAAVSPMVLVLNVKENKVDGWVGLGRPGKAPGNQAALKNAMSKGPELLGWAGLSNLNFPSFKNTFEGGAIAVGIEGIKFKLGGFLDGTANAALDNAGLSFAGAADIKIGAAGSGHIDIARDASGALSGKGGVIVSVGPAGGSITASLSRGFFNVMGSVAYSNDRLSGKITICLTDEQTASEITKKKPEGGAAPIELPGPDTPIKPGNRAFCGWGELNFRVNDWLAGTAMVVVNNKGQATVVGEIAPPKEFTLFDLKEWKKNIFTFKVKAGYGIPVVGQVGVFASIGLDAVARVGPGILKDIKLKGAYSTDPEGPKALSIEGTINISAYAGLDLVVKAGLFLTILSHDIEAGVQLTASAGVRGYVQATPRIGMREPKPGKREYYIQGHMEIAAEPVLGFGGKLYVSIDTPWWSPLSDKTWTWPLFELEYPLPGEFGIGADVDYVLGSKKWPEIEFGEVDFDGEKFLGDVMNDNTDKGHGGEKKQPGDWEEGLSGKGPGGAKNKGGSGKTPQDPDDDIGPIGQDLSFNDGVEQHTLSIEEKPGDAEVMVASKKRPVKEDALDAKLKWIPELPVADLPKAGALLNKVIADADKANVPAKDLAIKKQAARNIKAIAAKEGRKGRKKKGKGKKDIKAEQKLAKLTEKELKDPVQALKTMLARIPFEPLTGDAGMFAGHKQPLSIVEKGGVLALRAGTIELGEQLETILEGPIAAAKNQSGREAVRRTLKAVTPTLKELKKIRVTEGKILRRQAERLPGFLAQATGAVSVLGFGEGLKVTSLRRATYVDPTKTLPVKFAFYRLPEPYNEGLKDEVRKQIGEHQTNINKMTVDTFVVRADTFRLDEFVWYKDLVAHAKRAVADELAKRAAKESERAARSIAELQAEIKNLEATATKARDEAAILTQQIEDAQACTAKAAALRRKLRRQREEAEAEEQRIGEKIAEKQGFIKGERALKRDANRATKKLATLDPTDKADAQELLESEEVKRLTRLDNNEQLNRRHAEALAALHADKKFMRAWRGMREKLKGHIHAFTHNPDKVISGEGIIDDTVETVIEPPDQQSSPQHWKDWKNYLEEVKKMIGAQYVNKRLGGFAGRGEIKQDAWPQHYPAVRAHAESQARTPKAHGLWRMSVKLSPIYLAALKRQK